MTNRNNHKKWVISLLEEIEKVNKMIELSRHHKDDLAILQYENLKNRFLSELTTVLVDLKIEAHLKLAA
jgi:hypothetical protein